MAEGPMAEEPKILFYFIFILPILSNIYKSAQTRFCDTTANELNKHKVTTEAHFISR